MSATEPVWFSVGVIHGFFTTFALRVALLV